QPALVTRVKMYTRSNPMFDEFGITAELEKALRPKVWLKSGGYIVINQTEALVAIDVNSGKATREHNIEDTALKTNLEASEEIARQLRLRDLAGLIVIDFIDMDERRNSRLVERRLKESLRNDRARIQVGRISHFGLMEMSRQRLRTGVLEGSTTACPICQGTGVVRSIESVALDILRSIEDRLITDGVVPLVATTAVDVALYILNQKRAHLKDIELRYQTPITVTADEDLHVSQFVIERSAETEMANGGSAVVHMDWAHHHPTEPAPPAHPAPAAEAEGDSAQRRSRRRRRKRRGPGEQDQDRARSAPARLEKPEADEMEDDEPTAEIAAREPAARTGAGGEAGGQARKPRRRGRRGGRRGRTGPQPERATTEAGAPQTPGRANEALLGDATHGERARDDAAIGPSAMAAPLESRPEAQPRNGDGRQERPAREQKPAFSAVPATEQPLASPDVGGDSEAEAGPRRRGWWQR
ncbi:MAG: ribonuclease E/G, partial [Methyloceanibacter sp.]